MKHRSIRIQNSSYFQKMAALFFVIKTLPKFSKFEISSPGSLSAGSPDLRTDLGALFDLNGSDKGSFHGYDVVYRELLCEFRSTVSNLLEIGIGSNDPQVQSNMGIAGTPGASLRVWKDYFPNALIFGADIDQKSFIYEDRIFCLHVDQLSVSSLIALEENLPESLDVIVIDGLHTLKADFLTVIHLKNKLNTNGFIFIEDVSNRAKLVWAMVGWSMKKDYQMIFHVCRSKKTFLISIKRISN
jgi:hypothetical protein